MKEKIKLIWHPSARKDLKSIHDFIKKKSPQGAKKVKDDIIKEAKSLILFPEKHQVEELLGSPYRYGVVRENYKIIYRPINDGVYVIAIFDTRQDSVKIKKLKK